MNFNDNYMTDSLPNVSDYDCFSIKKGKPSRLRFYDVTHARCSRGLHQRCHGGEMGLGEATRERVALSEAPAVFSCTPYGNHQSQNSDHEPLLLNVTRKVDLAEKVEEFQ